MSRQRANPLTPHRIPLVRHCTTSNLVLLKGLFNLLQVGEQPDVGGDFVCGRGKGGEGREDVDVDFARVGLSGHGVGGRES